MALQTPVELVPQTDTFDQWRQKTNGVINQSNQTVIDVGDLDLLTTSTQDNIVAAINALNADRTLTLLGDVSGDVTFDGEGNINLFTTIVHDAVQLGVDTVGEYVAGINSNLKTINVDLCHPGSVYCDRVLTSGAGYHYGTTTATISAPETAGGTQALAEVVLSGAPVTSLTLGNGGSGYYIGSTGITLSAPDVAGGVQATASLTLSGGVVTALTHTAGGSGYTNAALTISAPDVAGGTTATGSFTFSGAPVTSLTLNNGGSGYDIGNTTITLSAPEKSGGVTATASLTLSGGTVNGITLTGNGSGFSAGSSSVVLSAPDVAGGTQATASFTLSGASVEDVVVTNVGAAYTNATITFSAPDVAGGIQATGQAIFSGSPVIQCYVGLVGGSGYHAATTTLTFSMPEKVGGVRATAVPTIVDGVITDVTITNPGSGYLNAPTITIVDTNPVPGSGAVAVAIIGKFTVVDVLITNSGSGYLYPPTVTIAGDGVQAAATSSIGTSSVTSVTLTNGGSGYLYPPTVTFSGGFNATATTTITKSSVTSVTLTNAGSGYLNPPTVTIAGDGTGATATTTIGTFSIDTVTLTNAGAGYLYPPTVTISGDGTGATATTTIGGSSVATITLTNAGSGYLIPPTVTFTGVGSDAAASTTVGTSTVTDILITEPGTGYVTAPTITITDSHVDAGAGATALLAVSIESSTVAMDLPETGVSAGTYGLNNIVPKIPTFTVDQYGRLTNATEFTIPVTGVSAGSYGDTTHIPTFSVDQYGRLTAASQVEISTTLTVNGDTGTTPVNLLYDELDVIGDNGIKTTVSNDTITIELDQSSQATVRQLSVTEKPEGLNDVVRLADLVAVPGDLAITAIGSLDLQMTVANPLAGSVDSAGIPSYISNLTDSSSLGDLTIAGNASSLGTNYTVMRSYYDSQATGNTSGSISMILDISKACGLAQLKYKVGSTGTVGSITGTGPWNATITNIDTTGLGLVVGASIDAMSDAGSLYTGTPTSVVITAVTASSVSYTVTGGSTPVAGDIHDICTSTGTTISAKWKGNFRINAFSALFKMREINFWDYGGTGNPNNATWEYSINMTPVTNDPDSANYGKYTVQSTIYAAQYYHNANLGARWLGTATKFRNIT